MSVQSAVAADLPVRAPVAPPPLVHRWDGLYVSFSAGSTWTDVNETLAESSTQTSTSNSFFNGVLIDTFISSSNGTATDSQSGNNYGAVFTFTAGYNVVWGGWLAGIQSEVSWNRNNIRLEGTRSSTETSVSQTVFPVALTPSQTTNTFTSTPRSNLENQWTVSEMVRIGYLVTPDWLVYGLVGWSWGGFEWDIGSNPFTLSGITYGAGIEKDFGWLRAFVQYKGINYDSDDINFSFANSSQQTFTQGAFSQVFNQTFNTSAVRSFSADVHQITAGLTIPINSNLWDRFALFR